MLQEIRTTHDKVVQCLAEAERAKREHQQLRQKTETLLLQLQVILLFTSPTYLLCHCY